MKKIAPRAISFVLCSLILLTGVFAQGIQPETGPGNITAAAALLVDANTDTILYEKSIYEQRSMASTTKVMTALLVIEAIERGTLRADELLMASEASLADITEDSSTANIIVGEQMSVEHLLYCLMLASANEASNILAEGVSGSIPAFIEEMNKRAAELGMEQTGYANPHGLDAAGHHTTAYDLYLLTRKAMEYPLYREIVSTASITIPATNAAEPRELLNSNALLAEERYGGAYYYSNNIGGKTGTTGGAGNCLTSVSQSGDRTLYAVILGAETVEYDNGSIVRFAFTESRDLFRWGFSAFRDRTLVAADSPICEVPVILGQGVSHVVAYPSEAVVSLLPSDFDISLLEQRVLLHDEEVTAPLSRGDVLGRLTLSYDGAVYGTVDLVSSGDIARSVWATIWYVLWTILSHPLLWLAVAAVVVVALIRYRRALGREPRRQRMDGVDGDKVVRYPGNGERSYQNSGRTATRPGRSGSRVRRDTSGRSRRGD